jgi:hypothetical protein
MYILNNTDKVVIANKSAMQYKLENLAKMSAPLTAD